jgi:hypothetical protein
VTTLRDRSHAHMAKGLLGGDRPGGLAVGTQATEHCVVVHAWAFQIAGLGEAVQVR